MVCKEDVAKWFKGLEGDQRIDLMCSLLDCCLPLELRFLGTYIEFAASKHYGNLQKYEKTANESTFGELRDLYDATVRRKFCIYLALLYSYNKKAATELYRFLEHFELTDKNKNSSEDRLSVNGVSCPEDDTFLNEMKLLLSMASYHPAFTFQQKENLRKKLTREVPASLTPRRVSSDATPLKEHNSEGIRRSPQISSSLSELAYLQDNISHISIATNTQSTARLPTRYHAVTYSPIYQPAPPMPGSPFQGIAVCNIGSVHTIQAPITVFPTNSLPQVAPNMQPILVKKTTVTKAAGMAQGPNGVIQPIYPAPMFASQIPSSTSSDTYQQNDYRFATPPIPVRTNRMYGPFNQRGFNAAQQQQMPFNYNMSPYQSPMESPLTSPFTSPSPSPRSSPLPSPRLSPFPSPVDSPMFRKKFDRSSSRRNSEQFTSVYDWLKSLRLHKYSETFKDYTFQDMKDLTDDDLERLGLTKGATKKFKLHINSLIERGFKGFGRHVGQQPEGARHSSTGSYVDTPSHRKVSSSSAESAIVPISSPAAVSKSIPITGTALPNDSSYDTKDTVVKSPNATQNMAVKYGVSSEMIKEEMRRELIRCGEEHFAEKSSDDGSQCTSEDLDESFSDDEVFMTRRPTVIENKDCQCATTSCYNCGSKEHYGDQCVQQTMEGETYLRYGYHIKYNDERLNEDKR